MENSGLKTSGMGSMQEYLLQGSILETHRDTLLHRLMGLCDCSGTGPEKFYDHEMVFQIRGAPNVGGAPLQLRVRRSLDQDQQDAPWQIRYTGQAEIGDKSRHTLVRNCIEVGASDNVVQFLHEMGFKMDHEYSARGYLFRKGRMKITVSKVFKLNQPGNLDSNETMTQSYLVELSVVVPQGQDQIQDDMKNFADQLKPLIQLEKIDHRRLNQT